MGLFDIFRKKVYVIGDHEVVKVKRRTGMHTSPRYDFKCKRCDRTQEDRSSFESFDCHECNCKFCKR